MEKCKFPECDRDALTKGYCGGHYRQVQRGRGLTLLNPNKTKKDVPCRIEGCETVSYCKGYCRRHYSQLYHNHPLELQIKRITKDDSCCKFDGCLEPHYAKGFCRNHYLASRRKSKLFELEEENQRLRSEIEQLKSEIAQLKGKQYFDPDHGYDCLCSFCAKWHPLGRKAQ